jgi:hypothetical protein
LDCNSKEYFGKYRVYSLWSAINANSERFTNELFTPSDSSASLLAPSTLSKNIKCASSHPALRLTQMLTLALTRLCGAWMQAVEGLLLPLGSDASPARARLPVLLN